MSYLLLILIAYSTLSAIEYQDVAHLSELSSPPQGCRYFDFIGGTKGIRCFIAPQDMSRTQFIEENEALLDPCLTPIYKNAGITIKQDASFPVPGFYIVAPIQPYRSLDTVDEITHLRMFFLLREIRRAMRDVLGIEYAHVYYEEKADKSCNVHYWILPIHDIKKYPRIYNFDVLKYLEQFNYQDNHIKIKEFNNKLKRYIEKSCLVERDNQLINLLKGNL
ncbi:MAG TPA: hypothetical protein VHA52_11480 [Candidatus Babeliaceae bacterium]|nr:hypothetical protein [Candidatus Babeliaceae bacterium]